MKKVNKRGFLLAETIGISVVVITALIIIYTQFINVDNSYYRTYNYNNVNKLYLANQLKQFLSNEDININEGLYADITECNDFVEYMYCDSLVDAIDAKRVIVTKNDVTDLSNNINNYDFSEAMKKYIKSSKTKEDGYRLIIEFEDNTIAGLKIDGSNINYVPVIPSEPKCKYEIGQEFTFEYTGNIQEFITECDGVYKLEVWGAQGGNNGGSGGKGGYSSGNVTLNENNSLYVVVGGQGGRTQGGYNGGGSAMAETVFNPSAGGGATHIGTFNTTLSAHGSTSGLYIVAGGGGGGYRGSTDAGEYDVIVDGGFGGGLTGGNGIWKGVSSGGATQTSGYQFGQGFNSDISFSSGGGGGLYGGSMNSNYGSAGGGSGYIGGVTDGTTTSNVREGNGYAKITLVSIDN